MPKISLVGPTNLYSIPDYDSQRCVNWYPEKAAIATSKDDFILVPTPGLKAFSEIPSGEIRGAREVKGRAFVVYGGNLYEILSNGTYLLRGVITTSYTNPVSISDNGFQLCVVDGTLTGGWILDLDTNVFSQITNPYFIGAVTVVFANGFFVFNAPNSAKIYISDLYNGLTGDPTDVITAEGSPDNLTCLAVLQGQIYAIGAKTTEIFSANDNGAGFPFSPISGAFSEFGTSSPYSAITTANALFFLSVDKDGANIVIRFESYNPNPISTIAIEGELSKYDLTYATIHTYQELGHNFLVVNAPLMPTTFVYDTTIGLWHERAYYNSTIGNYTKHRAKFHIFVFGKHLVGDYENGILYEQSLNYTTDNGDNIRRLRTFPYIVDDLKYIYFQKLFIDVNVGYGEETGNEENVNPQMYLDWSDDNGHTYKGSILAGLGKLGEYLTRVYWLRLGRGRTRVFRVITSTSVKPYLMSAHIEIKKGGS